MGRTKKPKKLKPAFRIPNQFSICDELWKVEFKWCLRNESGMPIMGYVDEGAKVIYMDRLNASEDRCEAFLRLKMEAILLRRVFRSEAASQCSRDLATTLMKNFNFKWKRVNAI